MEEHLTKIKDVVASVEALGFTDQKGWVDFLTTTCGSASKVESVEDYLVLCSKVGQGVKELAVLYMESEDSEEDGLYDVKIAILNSVYMFCASSVAVAVYRNITPTKEEITQEFNDISCTIKVAFT